MSAAESLGPQFEDHVSRLTQEYRHVDGPDWDTVRDNFIMEHPVQQKLRADIQKNGIRNPIKVDYQQDPPMVVDGHTRLAHAEALGMKTVPTAQSTFSEAHSEWSTDTTPDDFKPPAWLKRK